ncbi:MAG: hypothetical protein Q9179_003765 [Wetmoreana sp. 5 TL-2023]
MRNAVAPRGYSSLIKHLYREPDIEQGADVDPYRITAAQFQVFLDSPDAFMLYRRFAILHARALLLQDDTKWPEQELQDSDVVLLRKDKRHDFASEDRDQKWLVRQIDVKLSAYKPSKRRYESAKDYLLCGPPVPPDYFDTRNDRWKGYERAVKDLLKEPETAHWLNGPMFGDWNESQGQQWHDHHRDLKQADNTQWISRARKGLGSIARVGGILFWISYITAALSFVLITNSSGPKGHPMAGIIVVRELLAKGYV